MQCLCLHKPAWLHSSSSLCPAERASAVLCAQLEIQAENGHFSWQRKKMEVGGQSLQLRAVPRSCRRS